MPPILPPLARRLLVTSLLLAATTAVAKPPPEEPDNLLNDRLTLQATLIGSSNSTMIRYDSSTGTPGTDIDGEKDLGWPAHKLLGTAEVMFRMKERHRIRYQMFYLPLDRQATTTLQKTINFGDTTYNVNEVVTSELRMNLTAFNYTYSFIKNERCEVGASLGFDVVGFNVAATVTARLRTERLERSTPAPLVGLDGTTRLSSRFYLEGRVQYLKASSHQVRGALGSFQGNALYRLNPNITFGLGFTGLKVYIDSQKVGSSGRFDLRTTGPQIFGRVGF